ncbi:MAG: pilus assembly protein N-terminal domain-containing protein [Alphaproteobacteria bacterium]|nr:pilus assembly protein N-terminal domain-containing protein [Alphaproteobacteria bacterium]
MTQHRSALVMAAALLCTAPALADDAGTAAQMRIDYDQSSVLRLDRPAKTVLVGNPTIADAQLVNERTIYVLGRMFGNTNIIALDSEGSEITNTYVTVGTPQTMQVTLYRGPNGQRNLACAPQCERTVTQGDSEMTVIAQDTDKKVEVSSKSAALSGK